MTDPCLFVVLTTQRSGSSWLVDLLDSHPDVAAYAELFLVGDRTIPDYGARKVPRFEATLASGQRSTGRRLFIARRAYLRRLVTSHPNDRAVGFKLMYDQVEQHPGLSFFLRRRAARVVHLVRRNLLATVVSWEAAVARGRFRFHEGEDVPPVEVGLDTHTLAARLSVLERSIEDARGWVVASGLRSVELEYEHTCVDPSGSLERVLELLGVPAGAHELSSPLVASGSGPMEARIANVEEVAAALAGTSYEWMLA